MSIYNKSNDIPPESWGNNASSIDDNKSYNDISDYDDKESNRSYSSSFQIPFDKQLNDPIDPKDLEKYLTRLFRDQKKLKKIFKRFLQCEKIASLAEDAGYKDRRSLQPVVQSKIGRLARMICQKKEEVKKSTSTPLKFKEEVKKSTVTALKFKEEVKKYTATPLKFKERIMGIKEDQDDEK